MKRKNRSCLLGIIGGMGPLSDITFLQKLHTVSNAESDSAYIPVIYDGNCLRPNRSDYLVGKTRNNPCITLYRSFRTLENCGADVIVMPCNTAHYWLPYLKRKKRRRTVIVDMIYETCRECCDRNYKTVCLLATEGTYKTNLYSEYLFKLGVDLVLPSEAQRKSIAELISAIKKGERKPITELERELLGIKCDAFVLGCTELSRSYSFSKNTQNVYVDSLECLAKKTKRLFEKR